MGLQITISGADYSANNVLGDVEFDVLSDHISSAVLTGTTLSVMQNGATGNYEHACTKDATAATVTMPVGSAVSSNVVVLGKLTDGNVAVLYLTNFPGQVKRFNKDGTVSSTPLLYTMPTPPSVAKGNPVTVTHSSDRVTISYSGYSQYILYSSIANWDYPVIGVLATTNSACTYTFVVLS